MFIQLMSSYPTISKMLKSYRYEDILIKASELLQIEPHVLEQYPMGGYSKGKTSGAYRFVVFDLIKNIEHYDWLYERLEDDKSRLIFTSLIQYRLLPAKTFLERAYDEEYAQYFDKELIECDENEVFVDCGGFIGDTVQSYIEQGFQYKKIFVFEPEEENIEKCKETMQNKDNIELFPYGVGEKREELWLDGTGSSSSFLGEKKIGGVYGKRQIIVSLDEEIKEPVTWIKMDVEGFEIPALLGAKHHIQNESPKLTICLYHIVSDMWEIPRLIDTINPNYEYSIRHHHKEQNWETVLYAIPKKDKETIEETNTKKKRVVTICPLDVGWSNLALTKDCGLIPYLLYKNHNCESIMVGEKNGEYPYLDTYVKGLQMEFLKRNDIEESCAYIRKHAKEIDCLILWGIYPINIYTTIEYKKYNPEGIVYLALDANSAWMDRMQISESYFTEFMKQCDVIATSCYTLQRHLNQKWPWKIEYIPNGYYPWIGEKKKPNFEEKENIILTVARLGTEQKATDLLLEAFALIAEQIPEWKLRLVGSIEKEFQPFLEQYSKKFPKLIERVEFVGVLTDRKVLYKEYEKAKIFALPSIYEGGIPNVMAEAYLGGLAIAVTEMDAYKEIIDNGRCGVHAPIGDTIKFAQALLGLCQNPNLQKMGEQSYYHGRKQFDMERIVARLHWMIFESKR